MPTLTESPTRPEIAEVAVPHRLSLVVAAGVALATGWIAFRSRSQLETALLTVLSARPVELCAAVLGVVLLWVGGAWVQRGSMAATLPFGRVLLVQMAGSVANHVLPAGIGGLAVNLRFLRRAGVPTKAAVSSQALSRTAVGVVHLGLCLVALVGLCGPGARVRPPVHLSGSVAAWMTLAAACVVLFVARSRHRVAQTRWFRAWAAELSSLGAVLHDPARCRQLWLGAALLPLAHAFSLEFALRAVGADLAIGTVFGAYILASTVSALIPSPGGFGSLDVALTAALVAAGCSATTAVSGVVAYRVVTVWLPLIPSLGVLSWLVRRRVI